MRRYLLLLSFLLLLAGSLPANSAGAAAPSPWDDPDAIPGQLVVGFAGGLQAAAFQAPTGTEVEQGNRGLKRLNATVLKVAPGQEAKYAHQIQEQPGVEFIEPNYIVRAELIPNDALWSQQYGPTNIQAPTAWDTTTGSSNVIVAVIDSGIDANHPEFAGRILPGYDFVDNDTTPQDDCGHGTHVTGIIAAEGNNAQGIAGIAWKTSIMPVRVLALDPKQGCVGSTAAVADALVWAVERGARIINLSLGTSSASAVLEDGTYFAYSHGAAVFAAAGNGGNPVDYPAAFPWVMAVGATDSSNTRASFSDTGAALDVMAPGVGILSTVPSSSYGTMSGTSMAAAHASGAGALLASMLGFNSPDAIYQALESTALDLSTAGRDDQTGFGLIQIADALAFKPTATPPPPVTPVVSYAILDSLTCGNLVSYNWRDAASGGGPAALPIFGNDGSVTRGLPFTFSFGGVGYSSLTVSANGYATFNGAGGISTNFLLPGHGQPNNFVAPFWDDLTPSTGGVIYEQTNGTAPNREYVVEWQDVERWVSPQVQYGPLTFELVLFEGSGNVLFQYQTLQGNGSDGSSATVGVEYADGFAASQYSYNQAGSLQEGQALLFVPYPTGSTPPSDGCSTFTRLVDNTGGFFEQAPFCVDIPPGAFDGTGQLQIQILGGAPRMPASWLDLRHYADISLQLDPPVPLQPLPRASVCYEYTDSDVLKAGGYPENLFIASYDSGTGKWDALPTDLDVADQRISALAPHLSIYGVAAESPSSLPVTGAPLAPGPAAGLALILAIAALAGLMGWSSRRK